MSDRASDEQSGDSGKGSGKGKGKQPELPQAVEEPKTKPKTPANTTTTIPSRSSPSDDAIRQLLELNPALRNELGGLPKDKIREALRQMDVAELLTGLSMNARNQKDMDSYKFWKTQPVIHFDETGRKDVQDGPIKIIDTAKVAKEPGALVDGFEWATLDLEREEELRELYELLAGHYVEDVNAMFRFNYSTSFLNWALKSPGWKKEWHVGVRASKSRKLVASICGIPVTVDVRGKALRVVEINFLCVHKKLRAKRLAPVLIKEITRRAYLDGFYQAVYTVGSVIPTPVSVCRYYHRALNWPKLYDVGFSPLPRGSTPQRQVLKYKLPDATATAGLRPMERRDVGAVHGLLTRYLRRSKLHQVFSQEEVEHLMIHPPSEDQTVWAYVVEDAQHRITDFISFYRLESTIIQHNAEKTIKAAYLYYYATEKAFTADTAELGRHLKGLMNDLLILAKRAGFDVVNAVTIHDNPLFLEDLKFGAGDGQLYYYLFNYRTATLDGGVNDRNLPDASKRGGIGMILV
ncbi:glycylpeptide N-tetradecanoyltransferase [Ascosphaera acerosa]|nr:glycylpeptide N-tetradecanoyltransferase [Ascosphaera acerosa]